MSIGRLLFGFFVGGLAAGIADTHLPGKGVDVPFVKVNGAPVHLQPGAIGTLTAGVLAYATKEPALIGAAAGGGLIEGMQYTHHYAPQLFGKEPPPEQMGAATAVNGLGDTAPPRERAAAPPLPASYSDRAAASFFDVLDRLDVATT